MYNDGNDFSKKDRYDLVLDKIVDLVFDGKMKRGGKMPSENQLAKQFGISRAQVREIYSALNIFGVIESRRGEGTFFKNNENLTIFKVLFLMLYNETVSINDIMDLRKIMEIGIAEKAAENRTEADVAELKKCVARMEKCENGNELSVLDNELHSIIGRSTGNYILMSLSKIISGLVIKSIKEHWNYIIFDKNKDIKKTTFEQHKELVDSIINQKPYIAKVIAQEHLEFVSGSLERYRNKYMEQLKENPR